MARHRWERNGAVFRNVDTGEELPAREFARLWAEQNAGKSFTESGFLFILCVAQSEWLDDEQQPALPQ